MGSNINENIGVIQMVNGYVFTAKYVTLKKVPQPFPVPPTPHLLS